jgi:hypothetical protein
VSTPTRKGLVTGAFAYWIEQFISKARVTKFDSTPVRTSGPKQVQVIVPTCLVCVASLQKMSLHCLFVHWTPVKTLSVAAGGAPGRMRRGHCADGMPLVSGGSAWWQCPSAIAP